MQIKPMHVGFRRGQRVYGIRSYGAIRVLEERPWYRGMYYINGRNTHYLWDLEGRYMPKSLPPRLRVVK